MTAQKEAQGVGRQAAVFGRADEGQRERVQHIRQLLAAHPVAFVVIQRGVEVVIQKIGIGVQPRGDGFLADEGRFALVDDAETGFEADHGGFLADDVVRQPVQRADAVAEMRQQAARLDKAADAVGEVVHGRVDQGDDQHFLVGVEAAFGDQAGGQGREHVRFARARHGGNAQFAVGVVEDFLLVRARGEWCGHVFYKPQSTLRTQRKTFFNFASFPPGVRSLRFVFLS